MNITEWKNDEILQLVMAKGRITQKVLLKIIEEKTGKSIPQSTFSCKINRNGLKLDEFQKICKLLGYKLILEKE